MNIFIDTNVLVAAALFPNGVSARAYRKAVSDPNCGIISDYVVSELNEVFQRKFPNRIPELNSFLVAALTTLRLVSAPDEEPSDMPELRDSKDLPVLRSALAADADILLTGDKDFTEAGISHPQIITPADFLADFI